MKTFIEKWAISVLTALSLMMISGYITLYIQVQRQGLALEYQEKIAVEMNTNLKEKTQALWRVMGTKKDK